MTVRTVVKVHANEPIGGGDTYYTIDNRIVIGVGTGIPLASLSDYAQGSIIRGGTTSWEAYDAKTNGAILIGNGTTVVSTLTPTYQGLNTFAAGLLISDDVSLRLGSDSDALITYDETTNDRVEVTGADWVWGGGATLIAQAGAVDAAPLLVRNDAGTTVVSFDHVADEPTIRVFDSSATEVTNIVGTGVTWFNGVDVAFGQATATALVDVAASTASKSSVRIRAGTAPSVPNAGDLYVKSSDGILYFHDSLTEFDLTLGGRWAASGSDIYYNSGNVGAGTSSPGYAIHAVDSSAPIGFFEYSASLTDVTRNAIGLKHTTDGDMVNSFGVGIAFYLEDDASGEQQIARINALRYGADDTGMIILSPYLSGSRVDVVKITGSGQVGIGLTPSVALDVLSDSSSSGIRTTNSASEVVTAFFDGAGAGADWKLTYGGTGGSEIVFDGSGNMYLVLGSDTHSVRICDSTDTQSNLSIYASAVDTTTNWRGMYILVQKTAGVTDSSDSLFGSQTYCYFNQSGGTIGNMYGAYVQARNLDGTVATNHYGSYMMGRLSGGTSNTVQGSISLADIDTGIVTNHVYGMYALVDIESGVTSIGGDVIGVKIRVDDDFGASGTVYSLYIDNTGQGIDWSIYSDSDEPIYFGGSVSIGTESLPGHLSVYNAAVSTTATYYGFYNYHDKSAGVTDASDNLFGVYNYLSFSQSSGVLGDVLGQGTVVSVTNGTVSGDIYGHKVVVFFDSSATASGNVYGDYIYVTESTASGTVYGCYISTIDSIDIGLYVGINASNYAAVFFNDGDSADRDGIKVQCGQDTTGYAYCYDCFDGNGTQEGGLRINAGTVEVWQASDVSLKQNITPTQYGLEHILALSVRDFHKNGYTDQQKTCGFIAQEVQSVGIPGLVGEVEQMGGLLSVAPSRLIPVLVKAVQEQQEIIEKQQAEISLLHERLAEISTLN